MQYEMSPDVGLNVLQRLHGKKALYMHFKYAAIPESYNIPALLELKTCVSLSLKLQELRLPTRACTLSIIISIAALSCFSIK